MELVGEAATIDLLPELARQYDEPIADSSMVPSYLVSRLIRRERRSRSAATAVTNSSAATRTTAGCSSRPNGAVDLPGRRWCSAGLRPGRLMPVGTKGRNYLLGSDGAAAAEYRAVQRRTSTPMPGRQLLRPLGVGRMPHVAPEAYKAALCRPGDTALRQSTRLDFSTYMVDDILVKVDRASMLCSLEVRAPFLDPRLIEFALRRVPDRLRATSRASEKCSRADSPRRLLPSSLDLTRKQGFSLPLRVVQG